MIGIKAIASYVPSQVDDNTSKEALFNVDRLFLEKKVGVLRKAQKAKEEDTSDMCVRAYESLMNKEPDLLQGIDCIVVCTQNPDGTGLPHTSAILHGKLGLPENVAAFDISLGCSGFVYSLSVISSFMKENFMKSGILFTADPYSKIVDPCDKATSLLFGDAATATLIGTSPVLVLVRSTFGTRGKDYRYLQCVDRVLQMNGRAIFNFTATAVPQQIRDLLKHCNLDVDQIDLFILHQGSRYIVDTISKRLNVESDKVPCNLLELGNTVSSSIPIILEGFIDKPEYRTILISGFGVGLSWASSILRRI